MKILRLDLENFRAIKSLSVDFQNKGTNTNVFGANGTGKTTVANAISWLMTGEPITGEKDFSPKTAESHNLHHRATMTVETTDGRQVILEKDFSEVWTKKRGSKTPEFSGHTTDYKINGVPTKKKDYEAEVVNIAGASLEQMKFLTVLGYFERELKTEERRQILFEICGDIPEEEILGRPELEGLKQALVIPGTANQYYKPDDLKKIKTSERQKLNKALAAIPERIDEIKNQMKEEPPGTRDKLKETIAALKKERDEVIVQSDGGVSHAVLEGLKADFTAQKNKRMEKNAAANAETYKQIEIFTTAGQEAKLEAGKIECAIINARNKADRLSRERETLLLEFQTVNEETWNGSTTCPTCGQPLPPERIEMAKQAFLQDKAAHKADINRRGQQCSRTVIQALTDEIKGLESELEKLRARAQEADKMLKVCQEALIPAEPFEDTDEGKELLARIEARKAEVACGAADKKEKLQDIDSRLEKAEQELAGLILNDSLAERAAELENQQRGAAHALENAEMVIHLCEEYTRLKVAMVTENINKRFQTIGFQLFKDQINGGLKETCDPLVPNKDGVLVEYKSANTAAKINAGLEIIEVLQDHYKVDLPVIIDGAESVCDPRPMKQQTIKLIVSAPDDTLRIKEAR